MSIIVVVKPTEKALRLSIQALAAQIDIIFALGNTSQTPAFIARLKAQSTHLRELIDENENQLIETIQTITEQIANEETESRNNAVLAGNKTDNPELKEITGIISDMHFRVMKSLEGEKLAGINKIRECFAPLRLEIDNLFKQIDNLRGH